MKPTTSRRSPIFNCNLFQMILFSVLATLIAFGSALAETSPRDLVIDITKQMKEAEGPAPMLKFVHWPSVYKQLEQSGHLAKANISSPDQLKAFYEMFFSDPETFLRQQMMARMKDVPEDQKELMKTRVDGLVQQLAAKMKESRRQLADTAFEVGEATIEGHKASVPLTVTKPGKEPEIEIVELRRIDNQWFLPSLIGEGKKAAPAAEPAGAESQQPASPTHADKDTAPEAAPAQN